MSRLWSFPSLELHRRLDELFEELIFRHWPIESGALRPSAAWRPLADVHELTGGFLIEVELPGLVAEEVRIEVEARSITISGHKADELPEGVQASHRERLRGEFLRKVEFPVAIEPRRVEVVFRDGVLRIFAPLAGLEFGVGQAGEDSGTPERPRGERAD